MASDTKKSEHEDIPLVSKMESLELNEIITTEESTELPTPSIARRRSLRTRIPSASSSSIKRRVVTKPTKRLNSASVEIKNMYLCKSFKKMHHNLETIFEEPLVSKNNKIQYIGMKKLKRFITFDQSKGRIKKRQTKVKKIFGRIISKKKTGSIDTLLDKLRKVE